jgi:hypothetical protein
VLAVGVGLGSVWVLLHAPKPIIRLTTSADRHMTEG